MILRRTFLVWCNIGSVWLEESSYSPEVDYPFYQPIYNEETGERARGNKDNDPNIANKDDCEFVIWFIKRGEREED